MKHTLLILFLFITVSSFAQPQGINYQGVARDSVGHPIQNQNISLRLSILDGSATGSSVYMETQNVLTSSSGLFNVSIGMGSVVSDVFADVPWGAGDKWLKVEMDVAGGNNYVWFGTTQFLSVPYALFSKNGISGIATSGDMAYYNGTSWVSVPGGNYGQSLFYCNGIPTWGGCLPIVTTTPLSNIDATTATGGGNISNDGGSAITSRGVCWSSSPNPTTANNKTIDGTGSGTYASSLTGLTASTTYYLCAYAINSLGTSYGNEISFTSVTFVNLPSVTICTQIWTLKNLDVNRYRNGDPIPKVTDPNQWANLTTGAWCYYNNDSTTYAAIYGKLYNWYAVNDQRGLAPLGWHVPSDAEWTILENCLGGSSIAGGKMKETGTVHWLSPNSGATNSSGFTGLPGGQRYFGGTFLDIGGVGFWWSSTENGASYAWDRIIVYDSQNLVRLEVDKRNVYSVRCLKD